MDLLTLEVDGSLANPYAAGAVAAWAVVLSIIAVLLVRNAGRSGRLARNALAYGVLLLLTRPAQLTIGDLLYRVADPRITSAGFWGGPPVWIAPAVSCGIGLAAWVRMRRSRPIKAVPPSV